HNLKTAHKDGVETTGNASKGSYAASVRVSPSNFYLEAGLQPLEALLADMGEGLVITEVEGLHAGANAVSGDFSLLAKGYTVKEGKRERPVEQITIAGNFFEMLKQVKAVGSDLRFPSGGFGAPSVDVGLLSVAGKAEAEA
ncbi:MAG TPA: metallopeptidase TldD-related protein, partial [Candidatus Limiplasma sp.]|nr:metallopeptidase TldD-related protein [Candidatus Limiplasma sp.]